VLKGFRHDGKVYLQRLWVGVRIFANSQAGAGKVLAGMIPDKRKKAAEAKPFTLSGAGFRGGQNRKSQ